jgi:hypothetical protein
VSLLSQLYWDGIVKMPQTFEYCAEVESYLKTLPIHDGHVPNRGDGTVGAWDDMQDRPVVCPPLIGGTLTAPHLLEFALQFTDLVEQYLGGFPYLYSTHSFWSRPSIKPKNGDIQEWHTDRDTKKFVVLFVFGSDIEEMADGPHLFERGSHRFPERDGQVEIVYGKTGTCFFADTSARHMGVRPIHNQRLLHWIRWCLGTDPVSYGWDNMTPINAERVPIARPNEKLRESTKLLVNW